MRIIEHDGGAGEVNLNLNGVSQGIPHWESDIWERFEGSEGVNCAVPGGRAFLAEGLASVRALRWEITGFLIPCQWNVI